MDAAWSFTVLGACSKGNGEQCSCCRPNKTGKSFLVAVLDVVGFALGWLRSK